MPLYDYRCTSCGRVTEVLQRLGDAPLAACPGCGSKVEKLASAPALHFKGKGWYVTDYGRGSESNGVKGNGADTPAPSSAGTETKTTEAKPAETKPTETKPAAPAKNDSK